MIFNSIQFLWLFPIIFIVYYLCVFYSNKKGNDNNIKRRIDNYILLLVSYCIYLQWGVDCVFILLWITITTYSFALLIEKFVMQRHIILYLGVALSVSPLLIFKYTNFIIDSIGNIINAEICSTSLLAPLGISFYTFQALGYLFDVYYKKAEIEKDFGNYALFVCFFPQIISGPISKAHELLPQIKSKHSFDYDKATRGYGR